MVDTW